MRPERLLLVLVATATCIGTPPPVSPVDPSDTRAVYEALPVPETFDAWKPSSAELDAAGRVGTKSGDAALAAMSVAKRVRVLRAGLRLPPGRAAWRCARALDWRHLDVDENAVAVDHIVAAILDPEIRTPDREFGEVLEHVGAGDVPRILERIRGADPALLARSTVSILHKVVHAEHLALIADLLDLDGDPYPPSMDELVWLVIGFTDRRRDSVARFIVGNAAIDARSSKADGIPGALEACLLLFVEEDVSGDGPRHGPDRNWAVRWLRDVVPSHADAELLLRLDDAGSHESVVLWAMRHLTDAATEVRLRERAGLTDPDPDTSSIAACAALAVRGDAAALAALRVQCVRDGSALAFLLEIDTRFALDALADGLLGPEPDAVEELFGVLTEALYDARLDHGLGWDGDVLRGLEERVLAADVSPFRLLSLGHGLLGLRTRRVARRAVSRLGDTPPPEDVRDGEWGPSEIYTLAEFGAPEAFRARLRVWASDSRPGVRAGALETLLLLGDPASGPLLVETLRAGLELFDDHSVSLRLLPRSSCPQVDAYLRDIASGSEPPPVGETRWDAVRGLATLGGLPEDVEFEPGDGSLEVELRDLVLAGRAIDAFVHLLRATPDVAHDRAGDVVDPRVAAYLRRLRRERHLEEYSFATAELAIQGDLAARAEQWRALRKGLYRWCDNMDERQSTIGYDLGLVPHWGEFLESSDCQEPTARFVLRHLFDVSLSGARGYGHTTADVWRAWRTDRPGRFVRSRITGTFVPAPR